MGWDDIREKLATAATGNKNVADVVEVDWSCENQGSWLRTIRRFQMVIRKIFTLGYIYRRMRF